MCEEARTAQAAAMNKYVNDKLDEFEVWSEEEKEALDQFIMDIEEDWQWILASYCITDEGQEDGDFDLLGQGCEPDPGHRHVHYNADFTNDEVIEFGDGMDITGIEHFE